MKNELLFALLALLGGGVMAYLNYMITGMLIKCKPEFVAAGSVIRQVINVAYLAAVYFISSELLSSVLYTLVGAVIGLTVPMFFFTFRLVKKNNNDKDHTA